MDADAWDERYAESDLLWGAEPNRLFAAVVGEWEPGRALDLAAGEGRNAIWLARKGWDVTAVDFSPVAVERGKAVARDLGTIVRFEVADLLDFEPQPAGFDLVSILYLHLESDHLRLVHERAALALAPGGRVVVIGHDVRNIEEGVGGPQEASVLLSPETVAGELHGCEIERAETVRRTVAGEERDALDTIVVAQRQGDRQT
jgi:SAM-dependent methyltransferase